MSPARVAGALGAVIVFLGALGIAFELFSESILSPFNLDRELTVPALFSSALLLAAAAALVRLERRWHGRFAPPIVSYVFSALLVLAALDELAGIHERIEARIEIDWLLLYAPGFVLASLLWVVLLVSLWKDRLSSALFVTSGAVWFVSQLLEKLQRDENDRPVSSYAEMMVTEELLEMTGSACLLVAFLYAEQATRRNLTPAASTTKDLRAVPDDARAIR